MLSGKPCISTSGTPVPPVISAYSRYGPRRTVSVRLLRSTPRLSTRTSKHSPHLARRRRTAAESLVVEVVRHHARTVRVARRHPKVDSQVESPATIASGHRGMAAARADRRRRQAFEASHVLPVHAWSYSSW